ncbi:MAG: lamin tail domain-containing protein [Ferruginibacter sp.]
MRSNVLLGILCLVCFTARAQFSDNFSDGDFTANPAWTGDAASFIVNSSFQLQSNNTTANSSFYLSTASTKAINAQWDFYCQLSFNTSSANYVDVYLTASAADLTQTNTTGYFVRIGNTDDEISLYRKDAGVAAVKIIDGANGTTNNSNNLLKIRVIRNASNQFTLLRDLTGTGNSYVSEGVVTDAAYTTSAAFGIWIRQSTSSFFQRHFFDDIQVQDYAPDVTPPAISSVTVTGANTLDLLFNEAITAATANTISNYSVNNGIGIPATAAQDGSNAALVHLSFAASFPASTACTITVNGIADPAGNVLSNGTASFTYIPPYTPVKYDVVIDEIMADETPAVGLPEREWVELKNTTTQSINLQGWRLKDATGQSGPMPSFVLAPGAYAILCSSASAADLSSYGSTIVVTSFPSLNNSGELLTLVNQAGNVMHAVNYDISWYHDASKQDGGWTLEMINTQSPCTGAENWRASVNANGGTPGIVNSVNGGTADVTGPKLLSATVTDLTHVTLLFDESLDSLSAATIAHYSISGGISIASAQTLAPVFTTVNLVLATPLQTGIPYTLTINAVTDCKGNVINGNNTAQLFVAEPVARYDLVVNEILFDPKPSINAQPEGVDYVEIYNRSNKVIDLKTVYIANRSSSSGQVASLRPISSTSRLMQPQTFAVLTESPEIVQRDFVALDPSAFITVSSMPSYSNDKGYVILCKADSSIIDEIAYKDDWHFPLISNPENVSLERINYDDTTTDNLATAVDEQAANWHSAAASVGYGTPTYKNSQYRADGGVQGTIGITPEIISPDNDGFDDFLTINYNFPEPGYVANMTIFDAAGRRVRYLQRNALMGTKGYFRWDGLGDKAERLPIGMYVLYTEVFNLQGKTKKFKNVVVIARKR